MTGMLVTQSLIVPCYTTGRVGQTILSHPMTGRTHAIYSAVIDVSS